MKQEIARIFRAFRYSWDGFCAAWRDAGAFRTEMILTPFIVAAVFHYSHAGTTRALLLGSWLLVIVVELLNTGIEAATNLAAQGSIHPEAKKAKDAASAAVLVACIICAATWLFIFL